MLLEGCKRLSVGRSQSKGTWSSVTEKRPSVKGSNHAWPLSRLTAVLTAVTVAGFKFPSTVASRAEFSVSSRRRDRLRASGPAGLVRPRKLFKERQVCRLQPVACPSLAFTDLDNLKKRHSGWSGRGP